MASKQENYSSVNLAKDAAQRDWCLSAKWNQKSTQADVQFEDGTFSYLSDYTVKPDNVVIIGKALPHPSYAPADDGGLTGKMGTVLKTPAKKTVKSAHAVGIDFVFTSSPEKETVADCGKFLRVNLDRWVYPFATGATLDPITHFSRQLLAASSILAHPKLAGKASLELAKTIIREKKSLWREMFLFFPPFYVLHLSLGDVHINTQGKCFEELKGIAENEASVKAFFNGWEDPKEPWVYQSEFYKDFCEKGLIAPEDIGNISDAMSVYEGIYSNKRINEYVNKYAYIAAVSIMVRGGFKNLLQAFLSADPPIKEFYAELKEAIGDCGDPETLTLLK